MEAQYNLGVAYRDGPGRDGQGVAQDFHEALTWFAKAADQGYSAAQFAIGLLYADGQGCPWRSRRRRCPGSANPRIRITLSAEFNMGVLCTQQEWACRAIRSRRWNGIEKRPNRGFQQAQDALRNVADTGLPSAQHVLGMTWEYGWGSMKNEPEAASWYRKAAEQGYPAAEYDLGRMLADGRGVAEEWGRGRSVVPAGRRKGNTRGATETGDVRRAPPAW